MSLYKPGRWLSQGTKSASTLMWDLQASRTVRNKCRMFKPPSLRYFVTTAQMEQDALPTPTRLTQWLRAWVWSQGAGLTSKLCLSLAV